MLVTCSAISLLPFVTVYLFSIGFAYNLPFQHTLAKTLESRIKLNAHGKVWRGVMWQLR